MYECGDRARMTLQDSLQTDEQFPIQAVGMQTQVQVRGNLPLSTWKASGSPGQ